MEVSKKLHNLGTRIALERKRHKLSQDKLADKVYTTRRVIAAIEETGKGDIDIILRIADVLDIDVHRLFDPIQI